MRTKRELDSLNKIVQVNLFCLSYCTWSLNKIVQAKEGCKIYLHEDLFGDDNYVVWHCKISKWAVKYLNELRITVIDFVWRACLSSLRAKTLDNL